MAYNSLVGLPGPEEIAVAFEDRSSDRPSVSR